jgi:flagellar biogenesis protein FliO
MTDTIAKACVLVVAIAIIIAHAWLRRFLSPRAKADRATQRATNDLRRVAREHQK